jgi:hypothetical protein
MLVVNGGQISFGGELVAPQQVAVRSAERVDEEADRGVGSVVPSRGRVRELRAATVDRSGAGLRGDEDSVTPDNGR